MSLPAGRTHVILDGLQDPRHAQALGRRWAAAGLASAIDVPAQTAWLAAAPAGPDGSPGSPPPLTEADLERAAALARGFGLELRDRVGNAFQPDNDPAALRAAVGREYRLRLATALMFGLPALAIHYAAPVLAGGAQGPRQMLYPWLFQALLVGWVCLAAAWPILWQGALALIHLRMTADLLTSLLILASYVPSAVGTLSILLAGTSWLDLRPGPAFHATAYTVMLALLQRWLAHRRAAQLSGWTGLLIRRVGRLLFAWVVAALVAGLLAGWHVGLMTAMLLPPLIGLGAVNRTTPGAAAVLQVAAFALFLGLGPRALELPLAGVEIEVAAGFQLLMVGLFAWGWRGMGGE